MPEGKLMDKEAEVLQLADTRGVQSSKVDAAASAVVCHEFPRI